MVMQIYLKDGKYHSFDWLTNKLTCGLDVVGVTEQLRIGGGAICGNDITPPRELFCPNCFKYLFNK